MEESAERLVSPGRLERLDLSLHDVSEPCSHTPEISPENMFYGQHSECDHGLEAILYFDILLPGKTGNDK